MVHSSLQPAPDNNNSKLYMWRCIVAMAHADGIVHEKEQEWLTTMFANMRDRAGLPQDHYDTLLNDLAKPQDVSNLLPQVSEPKFRGQVVYFARLLAYKDGELHPSEEALLQKLHLGTSGNIKIEDIRADIQAAVHQELVGHEISIDSKRPMTGLYGLIDQFCLHFGIDLMDK